MMGLFGKKKDPKEQVRELQGKMRREMRTLDRQINSIQREEQKVCFFLNKYVIYYQIHVQVTKEIKESAKKGDKEVCVILAKSLIQSRKVYVVCNISNKINIQAVSKIHVSKAQINSVIMGMQQQLATMRLAGSLQKSTEVMRSMQSLVKVCLSPFVLLPFSLLFNRFLKS